MKSVAETAPKASFISNPEERGILGVWNAQLRSRSSVLWLLGWFNVGVTFLFLGLMPFDGRLILGINPWIKPFKFSVAAAIYVWTMGWLLGDLRLSARQTRFVNWNITLTMVIEIAAVALQSMRGTTSHFNNSTTFNQLVFGVMGLAILWNTIIVVFVAVHFFRSTSVAPKLAKNYSYLWGIRWGFLLFLVGSLIGGAMPSIMKHTIGSVDGGPGLFFIGWSTVAGDLRVAHFFGLHALQIVPFLGFALARLGAKTRWIHALSAFYASWVAWLFVQAWLAIPFL